MKAPRPHDLDFRQLAIFCKIVDLKNFTRAAESLVLTQPTLSAHIADLERKVGARLLDRRTREVVPTKAGLILYRHASELLKKRDAAVQELSGFLGLLHGELTVGASTIPAEYLLPPILAAFKDEHPHIFIRMTVSDSDAVMEQVEAGKVEIGVVGSRPQDRSLEASRLEDDELVLIVHPRHPFARKKQVTLEEAMKQPFIDREPGSGTRRAMESALRHHSVQLERDLNVVIEVGSTEAVKQCVEAGAGVAIVSRRAVGCEVVVRSLKIVPISGLKMTRSFYLVRAVDRTPSPVCREFVNFIHSSRRKVSKG